MIARTDDTKRIYEQVSPLIENPSRNGPIQCYNMRNEIIQCLSLEVCGMDYDLIAKKIKSRGCESSSFSRVYVYDEKSYASFDIRCNRDLCNDDATFTQIKTIFVNNGLTDENGRRIAAGTKEITSPFLIVFALIYIIISSF